MNLRMTPHNTVTAAPNRFSRLARFAPAIVALSLSWSASTAFATPQDGQFAINEELRKFFQDQHVGTAQKTVLTATADELAAAIVAALVDQSATPEDLAAGAFLAYTPPGTSTAKARSDKDKIAGRIVSTVLLGVASTDTATIADVLEGVLGANDPGVSQQGALELKVAGKALAVGAALQYATEDDAGSAIADKALASVSNPALSGTANEAAIKAFTISAIKTVGVNTGAIKSFINEVILAPNVTLNNQLFVINVAKAVIANPAAAGEVIGGAAVGRVDSGTGSIEALTNAVIAESSLAKAVAQIVASTAAELTTETKTEFTSFLVDSRPLAKPAFKGLIAAGAINAASLMETSSILTAAQGSNGLSASADLIAFGSAAVTSNSGSKVTVIAQTIGTAIPDDANRTKLGTAMVKTVAVATPDAAGNVAEGILASSATLRASISSKTILAQALAKGAPTSNPAVGAIAAAVGDSFTAPTAQQLAQLSADIIKVASKAATGVAQSVSALSTVADPVDFAKKLALLSPAAASPIAVGVSLTAPASSDSVTKAIVLLVGPAGRALNTAKAPAIAGAVALAVDVEKAADIAFTLSGEMTATGAPVQGELKLKLSQATALATSVAKAINLKPNITTSNRADELGELAASIVSQVLGRSVGRTTAAADAAELKLVTAIGKAVIASLSKKNVPADAYLAADQREAGDVAGSIAQTIAVSTLLSDEQKKALLGITLPARATVGALEKALTAAVGRLSNSVPGGPDSNRQLVTNAFTAVRAAYTANPANPIVVGPEPIGTNGQATTTGKYEIGSVNDPETPILNI